MGDSQHIWIVVAKVVKAQNQSTQDGIPGWILQQEFRNVEDKISLMNLTPIFFQCFRTGGGIFIEIDGGGSPVIPPSCGIIVTIFGSHQFQCFQG